MEVEGRCELKTPIELVCRALETGEIWEWPESQTARCEIFLNSNVVCETSPAKFWTCPHCQNSLPIRQASDGALYTDCEDGRNIVAREATRRWKANFTVFADTLRHLFDLSGAPKELIENSLQYLGRYGSSPRDFPVWLFCGGDLADNRELAARALESRSPAEAGVILTTSKASLAQTWPRGTSAVMALDAVQLDDAGLHPVHSIIQSHAPPDRRSSGRRGRPSKNDADPIETFLKRVEAGTAVDKSCKDEARVIARLEREMFGDRAREIGQIQKLLGPSWRAWKKAGSSRDFKQ